MPVRFKPTAKHRKLIATMLRAKCSREKIAAAIGCSPSTLKRHFAVELNGKKPRGVPARVYTAEERLLVLALIGFGIPNAEIAKLVHVSVTTLKADFPEELSTGSVVANAAVATSLYNEATTGRNVRAAIFWLKSRAGWVESGPPIAEEPVEEADLRTILGGLDREGRDALRLVLEKFGARSAMTAAGREPGQLLN